MNKIIKLSRLRKKRERRIIKETFICLALGGLAGIIINTGIDILKHQPKHYVSIKLENQFQPKEYCYTIDAENKIEVTPYKDCFRIY